MRLIPSDPDIETVVGRINDGTLDLQPDFQRGSVWSRPKQQLLIDSVLRSWYVPPIHVIRTDTDEQVVLDGQQRLRAISDFVQGRFTVDGNAEPLSPSIKELGGLHYDELPGQAKRRFDRFTLRLFEVIDYEPQEPYELFFRLNQPTTLTSAEKRNAFFGTPREQIKALTARAEDAGMTPARIGFSNARLAYEDIVARFVWTVEAATLGERVTASRVTDRYRKETPFSEDVMATSAKCLDSLFSLRTLDHAGIRLNKATAHSWLCFLARAHYDDHDIIDLDRFVEYFEFERTTRKRTPALPLDRLVMNPRDLLLSIFNDRATSRVNDVSSVVLRDVILWMLYLDHNPDCRLRNSDALFLVRERLQSYEDAEAGILSEVTPCGWEDLK